MDDKILKKIEEMIDKELNNYIRPPNAEKVKIKTNVSFADVVKTSETKPLEDWMKLFPEPLE